MLPEDWKLAWRVYQAACELSGSDREAYLERTLADQSSIREEVLRLLAETEVGDAFDEDQPPVGETPASIGPYRLIKPIGEGGMGTVFLAEQERPLRRKVALKLIRHGLQTREVLARFEIERQALAILDHPHIARVFDAGTTTPHGRPYFVMEFVDGVPINRYCEERGLDVRERLKLIQQVCEAIQHAHSRAIIHRDIKPANVLITEQDGKPVPRVIDFGVAKAVGAANAGQTMATSFGSVVGTLRYMSPEQAVSSPDLDARTDIYSVGVLLYELFTGTTPLTWDSEDSASLPVALKKIAEVEPAPPSRRLRESGDSHGLGHALHGEIDWIVMKALDKNRERRYQTANALARDIQRYLDGEPVEAGPPSRSYRLAKLAKRYRAWLGAAAIFVLMLIVATAVSLRQAYRATQAGLVAIQERDRARLAETSARRERDRALAAEAGIRLAQRLTLAEKSRADGEAAIARAVADFLRTDLLAQASPNTQAAPTKPPDPNLTVRAALDRSAALLAEKFRDQPLVRASLEHTIADAYLDLGLFAQAREHGLQAVDLRKKALGPRRPETLASMDLLATAYRNESQLALAEKIWTEVYEYQRKALGESNRGTMQTMHSLAALYRSEGKHKQAVALSERVYKLRRKILGSEDPDTMRTANNLAYAYLFVGKNEESRALQEENLKLRQKRLGHEHPDTLISMSNLALAYEHLGRSEDSRRLLEETLAIQKRVLGVDHSSTLATMLNLARALTALRRLPEAEKVYLDALELCRRSGQEKRSVALTMMNNLGLVQLDSGQFARAEEVLGKAVQFYRETLGPEHPDTLRTTLNLGNAYRKEGKYPEAESTINYVVETRRRVQGGDNPNTLHAMSRLVDLYLDMARYSQAAEVARQLWEGRRRVLGEEDSSTVDSLIQRAKAAMGLNDDAETRKWGGQALAIRRRLKGDESVTTLEVVELLASNSLKAGRPQEAEESLTLCLAARQRTGEDDAATIQTMLKLATAMEQQGKSERAESLRNQAASLSKGSVSANRMFR